MPDNGFIGPSPDIMKSPQWECLSDKEKIAWRYSQEFYYHGTYFWKNRITNIKLLKQNLRKGKPFQKELDGGQSSIQSSHFEQMFDEMAKDQKYQK